MHSECATHAVLLSLVLMVVQVAGYSGLYEQQGHDIFTDMPMILGAFEVTLKLYIHSLDSNDGATIFEITDFSGDNRIKLRRDGTSRLELEVRGYDGFEDAQTSSGDVVVGEEATWKFGVSSDGYMYIMKNGVQVASDHCGDMRPVARDNVTFMLDDGDALGMSLLAFRVENIGVTRPIFDSLRYVSYVGQPFGNFLVTFFAQFELGGEQTIFEFGNSDNYIWMGIDANTLKLELFQDEQWFRLQTDSVLVNGSMDRWSGGINSAGELFIKSYDIEVASTAPNPQAVPHHVFRQSMLLGRSNFYSSKGPLTGAILGLRVDRPGVS